MNIAVRDLSENCDLLKFYFLNPERYPFLLESVASSKDNNFDILFGFPGKVVSDSENFLEKFSQEWNQNKALRKTDRRFPFQSGWFINLAYELNLEVEPVLLKAYEKSRSNNSYAVRVHASIVQDKDKKKLYLIAEKESLLKLMLKDYENLKGYVSSEIPDMKLYEESADIFTDGVQKIKDYIVEGDVFQVNLSRLWQGQLEKKIDPGQIYQKLRQTNPAPFAGFANFNNNAVISSSPERLVNLKDREISTRPIAGTRPRGTDGSTDISLSEELLRHPKEQAEHIMLIDLERNDLGRVCVPGSMQVDELMSLESFAHVHHIVSNVRGRTRQNISPIDVIKAVFPGGTITGCPKVRCMQIINELEQSPRGAYTGSMGYIDLNGDMDLNILIRTIEQHGRDIKIRAGAGIVHDSIAEVELQETRDKAKGMLKVFT